MNRRLGRVVLALPLMAMAAPGLAQNSDAQADLSTADDMPSPQALRENLNKELMRAPNSVRLNFFSGLLYDGQSAAGSEGRQLAKVGYMTALRSDPTFWPANYQLGLLAMEDGDAVSAERLFLAAAFHSPDVPEVFYAIARSAYCAGDAVAAGIALQQAIALAQPVDEDDLVTAALVTAANRDRAGAQQWLDRLDQLAASNGKPADAYLKRRVAQLLDPQPVALVAARPAALPSPAVAMAVPATAQSQSAPAQAPVGPRAKGAPGAAAALAAAPVAPAAALPVEPASPPASVGRRKMALIDVVIIRRKEARGQTNGINLMDALSLQFGSTLVNSERNRTYDRLGGTALSDTVTTISNVGLTVPTVTYSLNIANAGGNQSSIEARPTLLAYDGQTSKVFSGGTLTYAAGGQLSAQSFTKEVGLSLSVTPKFNADDSVTLTIATGLETFVNTATAGSFREAVQTDKSSTEITADLRFGDTVIVSGGQFKNFQSGKTGVPLLGSVPLIGNLFRETTTSLEQNDLLVVLSVRREGVGSDSGRELELERVDLLEDRLWRSLGLVVVEQSTAIEPEAHRPYFELGNAGRELNRDYIRLVGLDDLLTD